MNRKEFISVLRTKLKRLPDEEIENAVNYYEEYFDEAGEENEEKVIKELGSPSEVATEITLDFAFKKKVGISSIWLVILAIFASPIAFPLALAFVIVILALVIVLFALIFAFGATGFALLLSGVIGIVMSIIVSVSHFATAVYVIGISIFSIGLGIIFSKLSIIFGKQSINWTMQIIKKFLPDRRYK